MRRRNNKGFSLVELIIVIAIMAILVGVLAPQYIKYVEKSRMTTDEDLANSLLQTGYLLVTDDDYSNDLTNGDTITLSNTGITISAATNAVKNGMDEFAPDWQSKKLISKNYRSKRYVVKFQGGTGTTTFEVVGNWTP